MTSTYYFSEVSVINQVLLLSIQFMTHTVGHSCNSNSHLNVYLCEILIGNTCAAPPERIYMVIQYSKPEKAEGSS